MSDLIASIYEALNGHACYPSGAPIGWRTVRADELFRLRAALEEFANRANWMMDYDGGLPEWQGNADEPWAFAQAALDGES